jgi:hypothetical protein
MRHLGHQHPIQRKPQELPPIERVRAIRQPQLVQRTVLPINPQRIAVVRVSVVRAVRYTVQNPHRLAERIITFHLKPGGAVRIPLLDDLPEAIPRVRHRHATRPGTRPQRMRDVVGVGVTFPQRIDLRDH